MQILINLWNICEMLKCPTTLLLMGNIYTHKLAKGYGKLTLVLQQAWIDRAASALQRDEIWCSVRFCWAVTIPCQVPLMHHLRAFWVFTYRGISGISDISCQICLRKTRTGCHLGYHRIILGPKLFRGFRPWAPTMSTTVTLYLYKSHNT